VLLQLFVRGIPSGKWRAGGTLACGSDPACWEPGAWAGLAVYGSPYLLANVAAVAAKPICRGLQARGRCCSPRPCCSSASDWGRRRPSEGGFTD